MENKKFLSAKQQLQQELSDWYFSLLSKNCINFDNIISNEVGIYFNIDFDKSPTSETIANREMLFHSILYHMEAPVSNANFQFSTGNFYIGHSFDDEDYSIVSFCYHHKGKLYETTEILRDKIFEMEIENKVDGIKNDHYNIYNSIYKKFCDDINEYIASKCREHFAELDGEFMCDSYGEGAYCQFRRNSDGNNEVRSIENVSVLFT